MPSAAVIIAAHEPRTGGRDPCAVAPKEIIVSIRPGRPIAHLARLLPALLVAALLLAACTGGGAAATTVTFTHGAVKPTGVVPGADGGAVGTLRTFHDAVGVSGGGEGTFDATMVTTSVDATAGLEVRLTTIVFSANEGADQLVLEGTAAYPAAGSTIKTADTVVRPVIGGSGRWAGARGWAESTHNADGTWTHTFHLEP